MYTVKCLTNVELGKDLCLADIGQSLVKQWDWIAILVGHSIQLVVVNIELESSISFLGE